MHASLNELKKTRQGEKRIKNKRAERERDFRMSWQGERINTVGGLLNAARTLPGTEVASTNSSSHHGNDCSLPPGTTSVVVDNGHAQWIFGCAASMPRFLAVFMSI
jgi:hypothetical protein